MKIEVSRLSSRVWQWAVFDAVGNHLAGGYCATKRAAMSDAAIALNSL
jgi:hypothetical protein